MKKTVLVVGGIAVVAIVSLIGIAYYYFVRIESEKNKARTANANEARRNKTIEEPITTESNEEEKN